MLTGYIDGQSCNILSINADGSSFWYVYIDGTGNLKIKKDYQGVNSITSATSTPGGGGSVTLWGNLPTGTSGDIVVVNVDGELCIAERGSNLWSLKSPSVLAQAYTAINPMPEGALNPYRTEAILTPFAANIGSLELASTAAYTILIETPPLPSNTTWTGIEIDMANINGTPIAPTLVSVALCNGGDMNDPTLNGGSPTWVTASTLVSPPSGTDSYPGFGKVCETLNVPSQTGARMLAIRIQLPSGSHAGAGMNGGGVGTDTSTYPVGVSSPKTQTSILGNAGTTTGWGEAFGTCPWFAIRYVGLSTPILSLVAVGDSHTQGYISIGSNGNRGPFGALEESALWTNRPNINIINMGRMGHTTSQISSRMNAIVNQWDVGGILRQRASINDHDNDFDVTQAISNSSYDTLQSDFETATNLGLVFIPYSPAGSNGWANGWFSRFTSHYTDEYTLFGSNGVGVVYEEASILNADGSYKTNYQTSDNSHPTSDAQIIWGDAMWVTLENVLTSKNFEV